MANLKYSKMHRKANRSLLTDLDSCCFATKTQLHQVFFPVLHSKTGYFQGNSFWMLLSFDIWSRKICRWLFCLKGIKKENIWLCNFQVKWEYWWAFMQISGTVRIAIRHFSNLVKSAFWRRWTEFKIPVLQIPF